MKVAARIAPSDAGSRFTRFTADRRRLRYKLGFYDVDRVGPWPRVTFLADVPAAARRA